jgi:LytS/YehU family sensor histidine kinase
VTRGVGPLVAAVTVAWGLVALVSQVLADPPLAPTLTIVAGVVLTDLLIVGYASALRGPRQRAGRRPRRASTSPPGSREAGAGAIGTGAGMPEGLTVEAAHRTVELLRPLLGADAVAITDRTRMLAFSGPGADHHASGSPLHTGARERVFTTGRPVTVVGRGEDGIGCPQPGCPLRSATIAPLRVGDDIIGTVSVYRQDTDPPHPEVVEGVAAILSVHLELGELQARQRADADAKLEALRAQINPHFLFNTLNTIASRVRTDPEQARQLLVRLADFFRYAIRQHGHVAEFAQEYAFVRTYVTLEQARFGDDLVVEYDVDPSVLGVTVPVLVIQPLVENAIKHGASGRPGRTTVRLRARVDPLAREVDVVVRDDGVGMDPATLEAVLAGTRTTDASGVGLANIRERLDLLFGDAHTFEVRAREGEGTAVHLRLPMR